MFGIGLPELLLILALALIVLGPDKLPQVAKQIARFMGELKRASDEFKSQLELDAIKDIRERNIWDQVEGFGAKMTSEPSSSKENQPEGKKSDTPGGLGPEWKVAKGPKTSEAEPEDREEYKEKDQEETKDRVD